jgi:UDP-N-acetylmuramoyl-L-alanyl-D-glutamate--2,6-diaminopimelate ligase
MTATLQALLDAGHAEALRGDGDVVVRGVRHDSRQVEAGDLFVVRRGAAHDGLRFVPDAVGRGAAALAVETFVDDVDLPQLRVAAPRRALGHLAEAVYGHPTDALTVIGITGTNGKTTTAWILEQALTALGARPAILGTVAGRAPGLSFPAPFTTPEGDALARFARVAVDAGATHLVMEVSSHALDQGRADAVAFDVAAFTNLSQDHLDYHPSMEAYFAAKARLFRELAPRHRVVHVGTSWGRRLLDPPTVPVGDPSGVHATEVARDRRGTRARLRFPDGTSAHVKSPLVGAHNLDNLLVAAGCLWVLEHDAPAITAALQQATGAPGRLEVVPTADGRMVLVDYAHTPDAVRRALEALRPLTPGRLWIVLGCGGDRDAGKRPRMGAAATGADRVVLTSDNPRTEDPEAILDAMEPGLTEAGWRRGEAAAPRVFVRVEDRRSAIRFALANAGPEDTVLIAGKGHEPYQIRGSQRLPFDDREVAAGLLAELGLGGGRG